MTYLHKDPDAVLDYRWDWSQWLADGEEIQSSVFAAEGVTINSHDHDASSATVWLSGGVAGVTATVTNRVTTSQGRVDDRTLRLLIHER